MTDYTGDCGCLRCRVEKKELRADVERFKGLCIEAGGYITATDKKGDYARDFILRLRPTSAPTPKGGT